LKPTWHDATVFIGAAAALAFGVADVWHFHSALGTSGDVVFIVGALAALGINVAYNATPPAGA